MDLLHLILNNGYSPILISGHGGLGYKPPRIIEGTGRNTRVQGGYSQTQVMTIPPQELKVDIVERDNKGKVKKIIKTINYKTKADEIAELLKSPDLDNDDILNIITVSGHNMDEQFKQYDEEEKRRHDEYMKLVNKNPKLKALYEGLTKPTKLTTKPKPNVEIIESDEEEEEKEETIDEKLIKIYKQELTETEEKIKTERIKGLSNPTEINRPLEKLLEKKETILKHIDEIEGRIPDKKYKPGKRGLQRLESNEINEIKKFNFKKYKKYFHEDYHELIDFIDDNDEVISTDELGEENESYFKPAYISGTINNTDVWKLKSEAQYGQVLGLDDGEILEKSVCVNDEEDLPAELPIKKNYANIISGNKNKNLKIRSLQNELNKTKNYSGAKSTFYDAYIRGQKTKMLIELKKYTNIEKDVVALHGTTSYSEMLELRRTYINNYWLYLKQNIILLLKQYNETEDEDEEQEYLNSIIKIFNAITDDECKFDQTKYETYYRKHNNYIGLPFGINKFPIPSPSTWNKDISPNTKEDIIHIKSKRKTDYDMQVNSDNYKINKVIDRNKKSGDSNTEALEEIFGFDDGDEYDIVFFVCLKDALLFFNLSQYLRENEEDPINLFELTDTYYTKTASKKGSFDSLNIPIDLFTPIDLMDSIEEEVEVEKEVVKKVKEKGKYINKKVIVKETETIEKPVFYATREQAEKPKPQKYFIEKIEEEAKAKNPKFFNKKK